MTSLNPYINFKGNTEEAFNFYKSVFGGNFAAINRFGEMPQMEGAPPLPEAAKNKIMHISLPVGTSMLLGSDAIEGFGPPIKEGNNFYISINTDSKDQADKYFNGLAAGGKVEMPIADAFWGSYFGMLEDKFGKKWMISYANAQK